MDVTITTSTITRGTITTAWWACFGCTVEAELPAAATAGCQVPCPDCGNAMSEQWCWDAAAA